MDQNNFKNREITSLKTRKLQSHLMLLCYVGSHARRQTKSFCSRFRRGSHSARPPREWICVARWFTSDLQTSLLQPPQRTTPECGRAWEDERARQTQTSNKEEEEAAKWCQLLIGDLQQLGWGLTQPRTPWIKLFRAAFLRLPAGYRAMSSLVGSWLSEERHPSTRCGCVSGLRATGGVGASPSGLQWPINTLDEATDGFSGTLHLYLIVGL